MDNKDTIAVVNRLIETSKDGEYGFTSAAEHLRRADLRQLFSTRADECRRAAGELQALVIELGGKAEDSGTAAGAMHRGWIAVKSKLAGYTDLAILEEAERGEDIALARYRHALEQENLPLTVRMVIERQLDGVKYNHAQVRAVRDQERAVQA